MGPVLQLYPLSLLHVGREVEQLIRGAHFAVLDEVIGFRPVGTGLTRASVELGTEYFC